MRVLFVCLGNICRSPTAEAVMRAKAPHLTCDSAGTSGWHVGDPPYAPMQQAAAGRGYDLSDLRARAFCADDFARFDVIIAMDQKNLTDIERLRPAGNRTPARMLAAAAVPDPYYTRDFDGCLNMIEGAVQIMLQEGILGSPDR